MVQWDMSFNSLLRLFPQLVSFILSVTFDTVVLPAKQWGLVDKESCSSCDAKKYTNGHILTGCLVALA